MSIRSHAAWAVLLAATLSACEGDAPGDDPLIDTRSADPVVALRSGSALTAAATLAKFGQAFRANEQSVVDIGPEALATIQFNVVVATLEQYYEHSLGCPPEGRLTTDGLSLTATFDDTCDGLIHAEGVLVASVEVEQEPCDDDDGMCPSGIVWTLQTEGLSLSNRFRQFTPIFDGSMALRSPLVDAEPMTWSTGSDFRITFDIATISVESEAAFFFDRPSQCLDGSLAARLHLVPGPEGMDDQDARIGEIVVEVDDYSKCADMCPESGEVNLLYGYGEVLRWFYDGSEDAHVTGPRGREFDVMLPCAM